MKVLQSEVDLSKPDRSELARLLGLGRNQRDAVLRSLQDLLSTMQASLRGAPVAPQRANHIYAFDRVRQSAERLYRTIEGLPEHHRSMLPDADAFMDQLATFHDNVQIGLLQMKGRKSPRGGGKKQLIANARKVAEHSFGVFFDLNAIGEDGELLSRSLKQPIYVPDRQHFVEYCMALIEPPGA